MKTLKKCFSPRRAAILAVLAPLAAQAGKASEAAAAEMQGQRQANVQTVMAYYQAVLASDFWAARKYIGPHYIEHDPERKDGLPGLQLAFELDLKSPSRKTVAHQIVIADGDLVVLMSQLNETPLEKVVDGLRGDTMPGARPGPPPSVSTEGVLAGGPPTGPTAPAALTTTRQQAEMFRLKDGRVVEHWITIQGLGNP
jgi:predicted SnoaL-like aldol condensation-catalyzing enzyme